MQNIEREFNALRSTPNQPMVADDTPPIPMSFNAKRAEELNMPYPVTENRVEEENSPEPEVGNSKSSRMRM